MRSLPMRNIMIAAVTLGLSAMAYAEIQTKEVAYSDNGTALQGYIAWDDAQEGKRPGILVVHEWWGHNDHARNRAEMLAKEGYTALALDMYGEGKTADHPSEAGEFAGEVMNNLGVAERRFRAAMQVLKDHESVNPDKIGAIGFCFGGGVVLHMARVGADLDGVVSFHGSLAGKVEPEAGDVKARILVCTGAEDPMVPANVVQDFKQEMDAANADYKVIAYEGAKHSFTNSAADEMGEEFGMDAIAYNKAADQQSWQDMKEFFAKTFEMEREGS